MNTDQTVYILGAGAIGLPLAAYIANAGRRVIAVRTSQRDAMSGEITVSVETGGHRVSANVNTIALSSLQDPQGIMVVTAKAHANHAIALELRQRNASGPIVLLQNGVGVERPFLEAGFRRVYRCVLYVTSQASGHQHAFNTRPITSSPMGVVRGDKTEGDEAELEVCVQHLTTRGIPFHADANINREVWKKAIINTVFNSVCPLLDVDNGVFARDAEAANLARTLVGECLTLTERLGLNLGEDEIVTQIRHLSQDSDGRLVSTVQDIRAGRRTEIEFLNLEIARVGASMNPALALPNVELLGRLVWLKSMQTSKG